MKYLLAPPSPLPIYVHFQSPSNSEDIQPPKDLGVQKYTPYQLKLCLRDTDGKHYQPPLPVSFPYT